MGYNINISFFFIYIYIMVEGIQTISVANLNVAKVNGYDINQDAWANLNALANYSPSSNVEFGTLTANVIIPSGKTLTADGKTITATALSKVAGLDQELKIGSNVEFGTVDATGGLLTTGGTVTKENLSHLTGQDQAVKKTSEVEFKTVNATSGLKATTSGINVNDTNTVTKRNLGYLVGQDQSVKTSSNVQFGTVNATSGLLTTGGTVTKTALSHLADQDQSVKTGSDVQFRTVDATSGLLTTGGTVTKTALSYLSGQNQALKISSDVEFKTVTVNTLVEVRYIDIVLLLSTTNYTQIKLVSSGGIIFPFLKNWTYATGGRLTYSGTTIIQNIQLVLYAVAESNNTGFLGNVAISKNSATPYLIESEKVRVEYGSFAGLFVLNTLVELDSGDYITIHIKRDGTSSTAIINGSMVIK